jgi:hypothetical protein
MHRGIIIAALVVGLAGCGSAARKPPPPTPPYQRFVAAMAKVGLQPKQGQAKEIAEVQRICSGLATAAEDSPDSTGVIYPAAVTEIARDGYSETQASAIVRAAITNFCSQWKMLLRQ